MATRIKWIVRFTNVTPGATVALPHGLNIDPPGGAGGPEPQIPDLVLPSIPGFTVTADATNVTVTNNLPDATSVDVYVETWHTIERAFGDAALLELTPRPFVVDLSGAAADEAAAVLGFGAGEIGTGISANGDYLWPWFDQSGNFGDGSVPIAMPLPRAGTIRNLFVQHNDPVGDGDPVVYTLWLNGVATALAISLASNAAGPVGNVAVDVPVLLGDIISVRASRVADIDDGALEIVATMRFDQ